MERCVSLRLTAAMRRYFDDLEIKPKNVFARGLFVAGRSGSKLMRGGLAAARLGARPGRRAFA